jgi:hypothetical protein
MTREEANIKIVEILKELVHAYPDQRFGQLLLNLGVVKTALDKDSNLCISTSFLHDEPVSMYHTILNSKLYKAIK